jgi:hypothetical protein
LNPVDSKKDTESVKAEELKNEALPISPTVTESKVEPEAAPEVQAQK